jgi:hypothetical protein
MGHSNIQTTMIYVHGGRKQRIEATAMLQAFVEATRKAKQLQEKEEAENLKPPEDEWGNPIYESEAESPQSPPQEAEIENLPFWTSRLNSVICARSSAG